MASKPSNPEKLTSEQQQDYLQRYEANLPYIVQQAHYFSRKYNQYDKFDDFVQEGCIALVSAVKGFDPGRGVPFLSYFMYWVHLRMKTFSMSNMYCIRVPERQIKKFEQYKNLKEQGKSDEEIATTLGTKMDSMMDVVENIRHSQTITFTDLTFDCYHSQKSNDSVQEPNDPLGAIDLIPMYDIISDVETSVEEKLTLEEYEELFDTCLDEFEQALIKRHYGFEGEAISLNKLRYELPRGGKVVSRERLRQKKDKALEKIKFIIELRRAEEEVPSGD